MNFFTSFILGFIIFILLFIISVLKVFREKNQNKRNIAFMIIGLSLIGCISLTLIYTKAPLFNAEDMIKIEINRLAKVKTVLEERKNAITKEIDLLKLTNLELKMELKNVSNFDNVVQNNSLLNKLKLSRQNNMSVEKLTSLYEVVELEIGNINLLVTSVKSELLEWKTRGTNSLEVENLILLHKINQQAEAYELNNIGFAEQEIPLLSLRNTWDLISGNKVIEENHDSEEVKITEITDTVETNEHNADFMNAN